MRPRGLTAEDAAIYRARVGKLAQYCYDRAHCADVKATDLWVKRAGYVDIERRVRCLASSESYWEIVHRARERQKHK